MPEPMNFHSAFRGFNREEVSAYLAKTADEYRKQLADLEEEKTILMNRVSELDEQLRSDSEQHTAELEKQTESLQAEIDGLIVENDDLCTQLSQLKQENAEMRAQLEKWSIDIRRYNILKDQTADIEMDARARAARLMNEADERARKVWREGNSIIAGASGEYDQVAADTTATFRTFSTELGHIQEELSRLTGVLSDAGASLNQLEIPRVTDEGLAAEDSAEEAAPAAEEPAEEAPAEAEAVEEAPVEEAAPAEEEAPEEEKPAEEEPAAEQIPEEEEELPAIVWPEEAPAESEKPSAEEAPAADEEAVEEPAKEEKAPVDPDAFMKSFESMNPEEAMKMVMNMFNSFGENKE